MHHFKQKKLIMKNLICIAKITKPHGVKGQAKLISYCKKPEDIFNYSMLYDSQGNEIKIELYGRKGNLFIVNFIPIINRTQVESLAGTHLYINKNMLPSLLEDEYYNNDLEGLKVLNTDMQHLGNIVAVHNFGAGDIIEIRYLEKKDNFFLPFNKEFIKEINLYKGFMVYDFISVS